MNGKQAKRLRREARQQTVGLPLREYRAVKHPKVVYVPDENGTPTPRNITRVQLVLGMCTRNIYKALKREYKAA